MTTKKKQAFKGTTAQHRTRGERDLRDLRLSEKYAKAYISNKDCTRALEALGQFSADLGAYQANAEWFGKVRVRNKAHSAFGRRSKLQNAFLNACVRGGK